MHVLFYIFILKQAFHCIKYYTSDTLICIQKERDYNYSDENSISMQGAWATRSLLPGKQHEQLYIG
jgi:hypothetical protein